MPKKFTFKLSDEDLGNTMVMSSTRSGMNAMPMEFSTGHPGVTTTIASAHVVDALRRMQGDATDKGQEASLPPVLPRV
jgi:hypothetical protein